MANNVVFFEVPADDPERIKDFYTALFDWQIDRKEDTGYLHITTKKGLTGGFPKKTELPDPISEVGRMNYISVDDVDEHCRRIENAGGTVISPKMAVEGHGWYAVALDPEGNPFGIWKHDHNAHEE